MGASLGQRHHSKTVWDNSRHFEAAALHHVWLVQHPLRFKVYKASITFFASDLVPHYQPSVCQLCREPMPCQEDYEAYIKCCKEYAWTLGFDHLHFHFWHRYRRGLCWTSFVQPVFYLNPTWTSLLFCIPAFLFHLGEYAGHGGLWDHHLQDVRSVSAFYRENIQMIWDDQTLIIWIPSGKLTVCYWKWPLI